MVMETIFKIVVCLYVAFCGQFAYRYMQKEDEDLGRKTPTSTFIVIWGLFIAIVTGWCAVPFILGKYLAVVTYDRLHPKHNDSDEVSK